MKFRLPVIIILIVLFSGFGCGIKLAKKTSTKTFYVLQDPGTGIKTTYHKRPLSLLLEETTAPALISSRKIIFSRKPDTRNFYQYASWTESPPMAFTILLRERLEKSGLFATVYRRPTVVHPDLRLALELIQFYHDAGSRPGTARIKIRARLFDNRNKTTIDQRSFFQAAAVPSYDAQGAAQGFSRAVGLIVDDMIDWLDKVAKIKNR